MDSYLKGMDADELLSEMSNAALDLAGSGARGRARLADAKEELGRRLDIYEEHFSQE